MREYRGKHIETDEWIYGYRIGSDVIVGDIVEWDNEYFCTEFWCKVDPSTVGQYTGLKDKNGKEIYEGDIMDYFAYVMCHERREGIVCFDRNKCTYKIVPYDMYRLNAGNGSYTGHAFDSTICANSEVIGSIHDNPELLEAE
ncbi:YopX family protein [Paenibacillus sp. IITD108]|uniref:YopX family protein n=1 Tax=Paenibacillus sp. IITD108 TaxID=3116649 RepID=UPI002F410205